LLQELSSLFFHESPCHLQDALLSLQHKEIDPYTAGPISQPSQTEAPRPALLINHTMSQPTIFIPIALTSTIQDPQPRSANPMPAPGSPTTTGSTSLPTTGASTANASEPNQANAQQDAPCGGEGMIWMMPMFLVLMYFMMIRPEQKRKKEQSALLASIKVGENVVMLSGMHGLVTNLDETTATIRTEDGSLVKFDRSAVARIAREESAATGKS
jgi:preprotein translocase subunit YajC